MNDDALDAIPVVVKQSCCLVSGDSVTNHDTKDDDISKSVLGYGGMDIVRNYCKSDIQAGYEVCMAIRLGGRISVWICNDTTCNATTTTNDNDTTSVQYFKPNVEFDTEASGTTISIRPPTLGSYYSSQESDILVAVGCIDGSIHILRSGILAAKLGDKKIVLGVVGDSSSSISQDDEKKIPMESNKGGEVVSTFGGGHACVTSLTWHPSIPNALAVGRKDGSIDIYSAVSSEYSNEETSLQFCRVHRLIESMAPIRGLSFSLPEGSLLFSADDHGKLYVHDGSVATSSFLEKKDPFQAISHPIPLVSCALNAHKGWIMNLSAFPDEKRVCSCGSDRAVKVWDCGMGLGSSVPVHSFEGVHGGWVWDVSVGSLGEGAGDGRNNLMLASCGNDGVVQLFSCGD